MKDTITFKELELVLETLTKELQDDPVGFCKAVLEREETQDYMMGMVAGFLFGGGAVINGIRRFIKEIERGG